MIKINIDKFKEYVKDKKGWKDNNYCYVYQDDCFAIFFRHNKYFSNGTELHELVINYLYENEETDNIDDTSSPFLMDEIFNLIQLGIAYKEGEKNE